MLPKMTAADTENTTLLRSIAIFAALDVVTPLLEVEGGMMDPLGLGTILALADGYT